MEALGSDAVEIPNGVDVGSFASAPRLEGYPRPGKSVLFLGRFDESRKGMGVLLGALPTLVKRFPDIEILIVGRGDEDELRKDAGKLAGHLRFLGQVDDGRKRRRCAAPTSTAHPIPAVRASASCWSRPWRRGPPWWPATCDAFRRVLLDGKAGRLVPVDDSDELAAGLTQVLENDVARGRYVEAAAAAVRRYDWPVVARQIIRVYETVAGAGTKVQVAGSAGRSEATRGVS